MKKLITLFFFSLLFLAGHSQSKTGGFRVGLNLAQWNVSVSGGGQSASATSSTRTGFLLGLYRKRMFNDKSGIQYEFFYNSIGAKSGSTSVATNYLSLPIFYRYNASEQVHFLVGPQASYLLSVDPGDKSGLNDFDLGLVFGLGADFDKVNIGIRYNLGLTNILKTSSISGLDIKTTNVGWQIVMGIKAFGN